MESNAHFSMVFFTKESEMKKNLNATYEELCKLHEGNGRISFHSLLSFLPSRMKLPDPSSQFLLVLTTYSLWNIVLFVRGIRVDFVRVV